MSRTIYYTASSLDGYVADAHHSVDWLNQFGNPDGSDFPEFIESVGAVAMGASTYAWILANHVRPEGSERQPWPYRQPAWVFSSRDLPRVDGDIRYVRGDVRPVHAEMTGAAEEKNIWLVGGGDLAGQFHDAGLLDELHVTLAPVTLGSGAPLFPRKITTPPLSLVSARAWGDLFVTLQYEVRRAKGQR